MLIERFTAAGRALNRELSTPLPRAVDLPDRQLDDPDCHQLAGLQPDPSSQELGIVSFCGQIPAFLVAPFAGVWIDRWDLRKRRW
jgi:hypothetical protein